MQARPAMRGSCGWIAVVVAIAASAARADRGLVAVVLKNGTTSIPATISLRPDVKILVMERGRSRQYVSYSDVEAVIDSTNANIAPALLRMSYRPKGLEAAGLEDFILARSIALKSGKRIGKTRFLLNPNRSELLILNGLAPRAIAWNDIEGIEDEEGRIQSVASLQANRLLAAAEVPRTQTSAMQTRAALPWRFAVEVQNRFDHPFGDYYQGTEGSSGFGGVVHVAITEEAAVRLSVDLLGVEFDPSLRLVSLDPNVIILSQEHDLDTWRIEVGAEYHRSISVWRPKSGFWFVHTSIGVMQHDVASEVVVQVGEELITGVASDKDPRFTVGFGAGVLWAVWSPLSLSISSDLNVSTGMVMGIRLGMGFVY